MSEDAVTIAARQIERVMANSRKRGRDRKLLRGTSSLLPGLRDARSLWARRAREVYGDLVRNKGGIDNVTAPERLVLRRAAAVNSSLEAIELRLARADEDGLTAEQCHVLVELHARNANQMRRMLESVGFERRAKDLSMSWGDLHAAHDRDPDPALDPVDDEEAS